MKIVIDIPDDMIKSIEQGSFGAKYNTYDLVGCLMSGTPLPKGHGRLIDADVLKTAFPCGESVRTECVRSTINYAPTIIEADKAESEAQE